MTDAALSILLQHDLESRLAKRKAFLKKCSNDGAMQLVLEQKAREVGEGPAWVRDQLCKISLLEEAQREMIRKEISKLAAEIRVIAGVSRGSPPIRLSLRLLMP